MRSWLIGAALTVAACAATNGAELAQTSDPASPSSYAPVDPQRLSEWMRTLGSDEFQGRAPGTDGERRTIAYLVEQFRAVGLEPGGENGAWTQRVPLIRTQVPGSAGFTVRSHGATVAWRSPQDIYVSTVRETDRVRIADAPMVFVGYGVTAPERQWDDFGEVDLTGKVAVFLVNDPDFEAAAGDPVAGRFGGRAMTYYGRWTYKFEEAARRGAIGALVVHETEGAGYGWNTVQAPAGENYNIVLGQGAQQPVLLQGWIQREAAADLLRRAGHDFDMVKRQARTTGFQPIDLGATFSADLPVTVERVESFNVIGRLPGAQRPDETIMFSGHWDAY
ncbi:MAG TPA: M28 family metallopeptidase, partial [Allosphingosinicella sp.]|nr:M28 family metallopeptidase [Allosphingosinicella sp.]